MRKIPLHLQIMIALVLGAIFGVIFNVDQHKINITYKEGNKQIEKSIQNWDRITFYADTADTTEFRADEQIQIVKHFKRLNQKERLDIKLQAAFDEKIAEYHNITSISKEKTPATFIKPIGDLFIRLLSFLAIPLVIASLIVGAASLSDFKKLGRIGIKTFSIYIITTAIALTIGLVTANLLEPGLRVDEESKGRLLASFEEESAETAVETLDVDIIDFFVQIVPKNPFDAMSSGNMLQIVFFAVIFGITLTLIDKKKREHVMGFFDGVSDTMIKMVDIIMLMAPYGVFALIAATIADFGFEILTTLIWYCIAVVVGLLLQTYLVYGSMLKIFTKFSVKKFFKDIRNAQAIGFSTSSSAATLPVTFDCVENKMGINKEVSGFVLPLGATINMDGTGLYQAVAAVFIAQVYGFDLTIAEQLTVVLTAVLASIGTAPVPGVGIIMLVMILNAIHVPAEGIALILGVDRILDMMRTITNVTGDAAVTVTVAETER